MLTLTGIAVFNIDDIIIHFGLSILIINNTKCLDINGEWLMLKMAPQLFENGAIELQLMAQLNLLMTQLSCNSDKI